MSDPSERKGEIKTLLRRLRRERADQITVARDRSKPRAALRRKVKGALVDGPRTVPDLAQTVEASTEEVLWHVMAMRAYGQVAEDEQEGDYFKYRLVPTDGKGR